MEGESNDEICWICLDDSADRPLMRPCACPRFVHPQCLARWQLQQAGKAEETKCRFCLQTLADWKSSLTPEPLVSEVSKVQPIMVVYFEGEIHRIPVKQGDDGLAEFTTCIRNLFRLPEDVDISLTFGCKEPMSGRHLKLEGIGAFDAAVHCASVAAAERQHKATSSSGGDASADGGTSSAGEPGAEEGAGGAPSQHPPQQQPCEAAAPQPATPMAVANGSPFMTGPWPAGGTLAAEEEQMLQQHLTGDDAHAAQQQQQPTFQQTAAAAFASQFALPAPPATTPQAPATPPAAAAHPHPHHHTLHSQFSALSPARAPPLSPSPSTLIAPTLSGPGGMLNPTLHEDGRAAAAQPSQEGHALGAAGSHFGIGSLCTQLSARRACRSASITDAPPAPPPRSGDEALPPAHDAAVEGASDGVVHPQQHCCLEEPVGDDAHVHAGYAGGSSGYAFPSYGGSLAHPRDFSNADVYGDHMGHGEHGTISGRFRTGVKTLAKRLATSLGRMVHHPHEEHVSGACGCECSSSRGAGSASQQFHNESGDGAHRVEEVGDSGAPAYSPQS